jgi:hypothetical protein
MTGLRTLVSPLSIRQLPMLAAMHQRHLFCSHSTTTPQNNTNYLTRTLKLPNYPSTSCQFSPSLHPQNVAQQQNDSAKAAHGRIPQPNQRRPRRHHRRPQRRTELLPVDRDLQRARGHAIRRRDLRGRAQIPRRLSAGAAQDAVFGRDLAPERYVFSRTDSRRERCLWTVCVCVLCSMAC